jgi:tetratricopeptide (TPR) repeat protein
MQDIFALQDEISLAIIDKLKLKLLSGERERLVKRYTGNPETYNLYLKGLYFWHKWPARVQKSREYFQRVIDKDPAFAPAYIGLANGYGFYGFYGFLPPKDTFEKAKILVEKALEIDDMLVEAHTSLAFINFAYDWDWDSAERGFKHALALNPDNSIAHQLYSMYLVVMGRFDEAIAEAKKALELEPLSLSRNSHLGNTFMWTGQYDRAIDQFHKTLEMDPNYLMPLAFLGHAYYLKGELEKAIDISQRVLTLEEDMQFSLAILGICYADSGQTDRALEIINRFSELQEEGYVSPIYMFMLHSTLGDKEKAFEYLEKAYVERDPKLAYMISISTKGLPGSEKLRSDPRFIKIIKKMGFEKNKENQN